jgi:hydroxymethylbilane synthase
MKLTSIDPRDALVMKAGSPYTSLSELPAGSIVGTSSVRRIAQVARKYPHLQFADVRGNVGTRLSKLDDPSSTYACLILAAAGLVRLDLGDRITEYLSSPTLLHAVGQGALGVEICEGDEEIQAFLAPLAHRETTLHCLAERSLMRTLEGGCSVPIGVETETCKGGILAMKAIVANVDGSAAVQMAVEMEVESEEDADEFGRTVAYRLTEMGAGRILNKIQLSKNSMNS